ncbi:DUF2255 family protein [Rathayibacter festucae]|uniref:DUF2255 domain-containing protein n=1 Tax=Rathayibacter festucae DSM 15932 TaxID=1328866 RepID=A0A3T0T015_9MICO|nr:DUF2255 family protein [Rathayibacter festucae]AZZ51865.1 DUF2255 domain-containing protein [Rathayibacter festucae DSM 15932]
MTWTQDELERIGRASELRIAGRRKDGTLRRLVIIWAVRVGDAIYARSVYGPDGGWFRGVESTWTGRVEAGGVAKDVDFTIDHDHDAEIDRAYRAKYGNGGPVQAITSDLATETTLRITPAA